MTEAEAAEGAGHPAELNAALIGFVNELKSFRTTITNPQKAQEERMTLLDRKTALRGRSPLSTEAEAAAPHLKAFSAYVRQGDEEGLRGLSLEGKSLSSADGGFLMPAQVAGQVQAALRAGGSLRSLANVVQCESGTYEVLLETGDIGKAWTNEAAPQVTASAKVARVSIMLHELSAMPKASQRLLDDAAFDVDAWLGDRIAERFARAEAEAFINGDGDAKPMGLLTVQTGALDSEATDIIGATNTGHAGGFKPTDPMGVLIDVIYALNAAYRANASFVMSSKVAAMLRRAKDADGRFLWQDSMTQGEPARLLGYPVMICEAMPDSGSGKAALFFGDFKSAYTIVERPELRILRDPFSAKPHVLFYASKRVGGGLVDGRAVKRLNFA